MRMSMRPNLLRQGSVLAPTCVSSRTSQTCVAISPSLPPAAAVSVIASGFLSTAKTFAPSRANSTAAARPLPQPGPMQPAPVISATFPSTRPVIKRFRQPFIGTDVSGAAAAAPARLVDFLGPNPRLRHPDHQNVKRTEVYQLYRS